MDCGSDHKPIVMRYKTTFKKLRRKKTTKKWNKEALKDEEIKINFTKGIEEKLLLDEENDTVDGIWKKLKESITVVAEKICGTGRQEKKQPWITIDIMLKMEERRKLKLENKRVEYKQLCKDIKKSCRKAREKYYEDKCKELEELDAKHSPRFFTKIKEIRRKKNYAKSGLRNKEGQIIQDDEGIVRRWYEYIAELYNDDRGDVTEIFTEEVVDLKPCIPETEILDAIKQLPKGKAVGEDNVPAEFLQNVGEKGKRMIVKLINKIYQTGELPADFLANIFIPIPKTSNTTKCEEHRTISLISHACKNLLYIIKNRITKIINEHLEESQFGFREGSGTRNAIYVLRTIGETFASSIMQRHLIM